MGGVKILIERGADISAHSQDGFTSLLLAAEMGRASIVSYMLDKDSIAVTDAARNGYSALHYTTMCGDSRNVHRLLDRGADINAQTQVRSRLKHDSEICLQGWRNTRVYCN